MSLIRVRRIATLDGEDKRNGKDSIATDAEFKVGDRVKVDAKYSSNVNGGVGIVSDIKNGDVVVEFTGHGKVRVPALYVQSADSSFASDANFKKGDKVTVKTKWAGTRKGIVKEVINDPALKKAYVVEIEGAETAAYPAEIVSADVKDAAADSRAADAVDGRYKPGARVAVELRTRPIIGKVMYFGGRPEVEYSPTTRTRFTGTLIKQNGYKWDIKSDSGEIYKDVKEADFGLIYDSRAADAGDAANETEKIAQDSAIVALFQPLADAQAELRDGNKKSNVKNVLAAALAAAEKEFKENPFSSRDKRIIDDAKKVLAQFDSAEANDACGKGEDAKNDFANRIMPLVRKIADAQKVVEGVLGEAEDIGFEAAHGEFPDSTFAKKSANQLEAACYEAVTALRKVKTIAVF